MKKTPELESKRVFLVASPRPAVHDFTRAVIEGRLFGGTIYSASDGQEALFKASNAAPHVVVLDASLPKMDGFEVAQKLIEAKETSGVSIILISNIPDDERLVDEVVTGQVQFLQDAMSEDDLLRMLSRGLNRVSMADRSTYRLQFLAPDETLFRERDVAKSVYFVKKGKLDVFRQSGKEDRYIGTANPGEFVGEMAHFNSEPRSATVVAKEPCELIEIPCDLFERVLFSKPAWAKALMETLSRRLKQSNEKRASSTQ